MSDQQFMIYGANGYTGELIARAAVNRGLQPILAGRNQAALALLADQLQLSYRVFSLEHQATIIKNLSDITSLIHCAGPFSATSAPMLQGCLSSNTHYTDISGEIEVFEHAHSLNQQAIDAGIIICPGVGFDVIPTDCIAAKLKTQLPDATHLSLGFDSLTVLTKGTAKTVVEGLITGAKIRKNGKLISVSFAHKTKQIDFGNGQKSATSILWGDLFTAYHSTAIPNIDVYIPMSTTERRTMKLLNLLQPILRVNWIQKLMKKQIDKKVKGPTLEQRTNAITKVWGQVTNAQGHTKTAHLTTANGYSFTIEGALAVNDFVLKTSNTSGYHTPTTLMGFDFVSDLPGSSAIVIS